MAQEASTKAGIAQHQRSLDVNCKLCLRLLHEIPSQVPVGLNMHSVNLCSIDVSANVLAIAACLADVKMYNFNIAANMGLVFIYNRSMHRISKIKTKNHITQVKLVVGDYDMLAVGFRNGTFIVYCLPSSDTGKCRKLRQYSVEAHATDITALCWRSDGRCLISGDSSGLVLATFVNFDTNSFHSKYVCSEEVAIAQLCSSGNFVGISSLQRAVVVDFTSTTEPTQIGTSARKAQGKFGIQFWPQNSSFPAPSRVHADQNVDNSDASESNEQNLVETAVPTVAIDDVATVLFTSRPGFRLWRSNERGTVSETHLLKELVEASDIVLAPGRYTYSDQFSEPGAEYNAGVLRYLQFVVSDRLQTLVAVCETDVILFDVNCRSVLQRFRFGGPILSVAALSEMAELFVLCEPNNIICISKDHSDLTDCVLQESAVKSNLSGLSLAEKVRKNIPAKTLAISRLVDDAVSVIRTRPRSNSKLTVDSIDTMSVCSSSHSQESEDSGAQSMSQHTTGMDEKLSNQSRPLNNFSNKFENLASQFRKLSAAVSERSSKSSDEISNLLIDRIGGFGVAAETGGIVAPPNSENFPNFSLTEKNSTQCDHGDGCEEEAGIVQEVTVVRKVKKGRLATNKAFLDDPVNSSSRSRSGSIPTTTSDMKLPHDDNLSGHSTAFTFSTVSGNKLPNTSHKSGSHVDQSLPSVSISHMPSNKTSCQSNVVFQSELDFHDRVHNWNNSSSNADTERDEPTRDELEFMLDKVVLAGILDRDLSVVEESSVDQISREEDLTDSVITSTTMCKPHQHNNADSSPVNSSTSKLLASAIEEPENDSGCSPDNGSSPQNCSTPSLYSPSILVPQTTQLQCITETGLSSAAEISQQHEMQKLGDQDKDEAAFSKSNDETQAVQCDDFATLLKQELKSRAALALPLYKGMEETDSHSESFCIDNNYSANDMNELECDVPVTTTPLGLAMELDIWCKAAAQEGVKSIAGCANYVCYADNKRQLHYSSLLGVGLSWTTLEEKADQICVSANGKLVWRVLDSTAYALVKPHARKPLGFKWVEAAKNAKTVALSNHSAWYIKRDGKIYLQCNLSSERPCFKVEEVPCDYEVVQLSCSEAGVWALTVDLSFLVRLGLAEDNHRGTDWVEIYPEIPCNLAQLCLVSNTCWAVDVNYNVWFTTDLSLTKPLGKSGGKWYRVMTPYSSAAMRSGSQGQWQSAYFSPAFVPAFGDTGGPQLHASVVGLFLCIGRDIFFTRGSLTGHRWSKPVPRALASVATFSCIAAGNIYSSTLDYLWLLRTNGELLAFQGDAESLRSLPAAPPKVVCISSAPGVLWILDERYRIFIRSGFDSVLAPLGTQWDELDLSQLDGQVVIAQLSCSCNSVWAVDKSGSVHVRLGIEAVANGGLAPAWIPLEEPPPVTLVGSTSFSKKSFVPRFSRVVASADGRVVWAIAVGGHVFCRLGITEQMPIGEEWVQVEGLLCQCLASGCDSLWGLTSDGDVFRRLRVSLSNPRGDYWKQLPSEPLKFITATPHNDLWGLTYDGHLVQHYVKLFKNLYATESAAAASPSEKDWEIL